MSTIAFWQTDITGEKDIAGASRFFIDIFNKYHVKKEKKFNLLFLTDPKSREDISKLQWFRHCARYILPLRSPSNRFNDLVANTDLLFKIIFHRIRLIHICQYYHVSHYKRLKFIQVLPTTIRPKIVINWIHCNFPFEYFDHAHSNYQDFHSRFDPLFNSIEIDGIFSWYKLTKTFIEENHLVKSNPVIYPITSYCCDTSRFKPAPVKENMIVWAARLHKQKRPDLFLEAVGHLKNKHAEKIVGWKFLICGVGDEEAMVRSEIKRLNLADILEFRTDIRDMAPVFARSRCFVSTQDYENFTSLSMNEALAAGNAIIARNVGQTDLYVHDEKNGFLVKEDNAQGLANTLLTYITNPEKHAAMQGYSLHLSNKIHTPENFMKELEGFWSSLLVKN